MTARRTTPPGRRLQWGFLVILMVSVAQMAWWLYDEVRYTDRVTAQIRVERVGHLERAEAMRRAGVPLADLRAAFPEFTMVDSGPVRLPDSLAIETLELARDRRVNRFAWEGGFFFAVLIAAMTMTYRTLHEETTLRRRQEEFLATVSHEFRTPLASMRLSAETLLVRDPPAAHRHELVRRCLAEMDRLWHMIDNVLEASRPSMEAPSGEPERLSLEGAVKQAVSDLESLATERGVTLTVNSVPGVVVLMERGALQSVLRNLIHNGIRASAVGGGVHVVVRHGTTGTTLRVIDEGMGFDPAESERIFEKFYRTPDGIRARASGSGLGLWLVRRHVGRAGGTVTAHSRGAGRGADLTVTWPAAEPSVPS